MTNTQQPIRLAMAPLQGHTDHIYRRIHQTLIGGIDHYYTPFLRHPLRNKDKKDVALMYNDTSCTIPQILGGDAEEMLTLFDYVRDLGYKRVDVNLGCPFPLITSKRRGSGVFKQSTEDFQALMEQIPVDLHVSLKLRLGWDAPDQLLPWMPIINQTPLHSLALHARFGKQAYKGACDLDAFSAIYDTCQHPLWYNGDINSPEDAQEILERFPTLAGVMIGRGLLADPLLGLKIKGEMALSEAGQLEKCLAFHDQLVEAYTNYLEGGDKQIVQKLKSIWDYFLPDTDKRILKKIKKANKLEDYHAAVHLLI